MFVVYIFIQIRASKLGACYLRARRISHGLIHYKESWIRSWHGFKTYILITVITMCKMSGRYIRWLGIFVGPSVWMLLHTRVTFVRLNHWYPFKHLDEEKKSIILWIKTLRNYSQSFNIQSNWCGKETSARKQRGHVQWKGTGPGQGGSPGVSCVSKRRTRVDESWRPYACVIVVQRSWVRIPFRPEFFISALISQLLKLSCGFLIAVKIKVVSHLKNSVSFFEDNFFVSSQVNNAVWALEWKQKRAISMAAFLGGNWG